MPYTYDTRLQDETFTNEYLSELTDTEQRELFDRQAAERVRAESERWFGSAFESLWQVEEVEE